MNNSYLEKILGDIQGDGGTEPSSNLTSYRHLRKDLIDYLGIKKAKGFLVRYGWHMGASDAKRLANINPDLNFLIEQASNIHSQRGHIKGLQTYERLIEVDSDKQIKKFRGWGKWIGSFEAYEHLNNHGVSDIPVCYTLVGYASGYMSYISGKSIIVKEVSCIGRGDSECSYEIRVKEDWGELSDDMELCYEMNILEELQFIFGQFISNMKEGSEVSQFNNSLIQFVLEGKKLQDVVDYAYKRINIPIVIYDQQLDVLAGAGVEKDKVKPLMESDLNETRLSKKKNEVRASSPPQLISAGGQTYLVKPIVVDRKVCGYSSFIYSDQCHNGYDEDMFLESVALASSLLLMNEINSYKAVKKAEENFLADLIKGHYQSKREIILKGRYLGLELDSSFYVAALQYKAKAHVHEELEDHLDGDRHIVDHLYRYLDRLGQKVLMGLYEENIILFMDGSFSNKDEVLSILKEIIAQLNSAFPELEFRMGISDKWDDIAKIKEPLEEALIAARIPGKGQVTDYNELGVLGVLINAQNAELIKKIAGRELGEFYPADTAKKKELIKTLYVFLINGGKLQKTMEDLNLSLSGLLYRIRKIEEILNKDLRNPDESYQLLLILKTLAALNELELI